MAKVTLAEIVAKWERQLHDLEKTCASYEFRKSRNGTPKQDGGVNEWTSDHEGSYQRTLARIDMMKEHIRILQEYALAHAR